MILINKWEKKYSNTPTTYKVGDYIYIKTNSDFSSKFSDKYFNLSKIVETSNTNKNTNYKLQVINKENNECHYIWLNNHYFSRKLELHEINEFKLKLNYNNYNEISKNI